MNALDPETPTATAPWAKFLLLIKQNECWVLAFGVGLQLTVLCSMIALRGIVLWTGDVYLVRVQPVDPRDWMRGDYVILSYEFNRLPNDHRVDFAAQGNLQGRPIYVSLEPEGDGSHWHAARFGLTRPEGHPFLAGEMNQFGQIVFGIEQYFVQEGKGHVYEEAMRSRHLAAEISVTASGQGAVRALHIEPK